MRFLTDFWDFGLKQFRSAIFGITIILTLALTHFVNVPHIARYDFLFVVVVLIQAVLLIFRYEEPYDLIPILVFHILGMLLEIFKVQHGSWTYPEVGLLKIGGVPLYSAFMYSAIGSYIVRALKEFDIRVRSWPRSYWTWGLAFLIYLNFFTDTKGIDVRNLLYPLIIVVFWRAKFTFLLIHKRYEWPVTLAYFLIGLFIYLAENVASYFNAWRYSYQLSHWRLVDVGKISSWVLLIIVSIVIVVELQNFFSKP